MDQLPGITGMGERGGGAVDTQLSQACIGHCIKHAPCHMPTSHHARRPDNSIT